MNRATTALLIACHFVCPLLFFTDLTRNPYFTQITLLNVFLLWAAAGWAIAQAASLGAPGGAWRLPRTPLDLPIAFWLGVCALTWTLAYFGHAAFYRPAMRAEGLRVMLFTLVNTVLPFYLAAAVARDCPPELGIPLGRWVAFTLAWTVGWLVFSEARSKAPGSLEVWSHLWDNYGAFLWVAGLAGAWHLVREGGVHRFWHLGLAVGFVSSLYGVSQYFNLEWIWPKVLNPYGGRAVSTFGNPNFMSSYMVLILPVALTYYLRADSHPRRFVYGTVALAVEACLLCSLTRSSWVGALAALAVLAFSPDLRARARRNLEAHGLLVSCAIGMILFWPQSTVSGYTPSVFGRLQELTSIADTNTVNPYSPLYQRVLIWTCAWMMGHENWLLGKGWGLFELFYPFYQGHVLSSIDLLRMMRTHANNTHNEILEVFAQTGVLGVGANVWLWGVFFVCAWRWWRRPGGDAAWMTAAVAGVAGMLVDNLLNVSMHFAVPAFLFWWQAGTAMGRPESADAERELRLPKPGSWGLAALAVVAALAGSVFWFGQWKREVHYFLGFKLMRAGRLSAAIEQLETAHRWHPREVNANYELGNAYARSEQFDKAIWAYNEALRSNAGYDEIFFNLATVEGQRLGRWDDALRDLRVSQWINPLSVEAYNSLSQLYLRDPERHRDDAIRLLEQAVRIFPADAGFRNNLGFVYGMAGRYPEAVAQWTEALRRNPDLGQAEQNLVAAAAKTGGPRPEVLAHLQALRDLEGRLGGKDYSAASLDLARKVAQWFPESQKGRFYQGNLELIHGRHEAAIQLLEPLARQDPRNTSLLVNLGQAYMRAGRVQEAAAALRAVLSMDPNNAAARDLLARLGR